jgi:hypothetical protein
MYCPACGQELPAVLPAVEAVEEPDVQPDGEPVEKQLVSPENPKRFVLGVASAANRLPSRGASDGRRDWMPLDAVEQTAWNYVRKGRRIGFYHADGTEGHGEVVESYIYRGPDWVTTDISGGEQVIKAGDWLLGAVLDEVGFNLVLQEKADGWSMDGTGLRRAGAPPK